jgi:SAM-dependent methyltransferase
MLFEAAHPRSPAWFPRRAGSLAIDLGCGGAKRRGTIGLDIEPGPGVDHVLDFERDRLPFDDGSVGYVFSSHCLEHLRDPMPILREITRVAADGAGLELWLPYAWHNDGLLIDHTLFWSEEPFLHMTAFFPEEWQRRLGGGSWNVEELVFRIDPETLKALIARGEDIDYALYFYKNVAREFGVMGTIRRANGSVPSGQGKKPRQTFVSHREDTVRREVEPVNQKQKLKSFVRLALTQ